jgi:acyl dehydratase
MYSKQISWEEVKEGQDIPSLTKIPTHIQMLIWGGAVDDYNPMHADNKIAERAGYKEPIVFGPLVFSFLVQMVTNWMGPDAWLKKIMVRHNAPAFAEDEIVCNGKVIKKYIENQDHLVEIRLEANYPKVGRGTIGSAIVSLPTKEQVHPLPKVEPILTTGWIRRRARP